MDYLDLFQSISRNSHREDLAIRDVGGNSLSYVEFFQQVETLSQRLEQLLHAEDVVVIDLDKSLSAVTLLVACIKNHYGCCFLDNSLPMDRKVRIIRAVNPKLVISAADFTASGITSANLDSLTAQSINPSDRHFCGNIIFTSGSTGEPKGVMLSNTAIAHYVDSMLEVMGSRNGTWLSLSPLHFDVFQLDFLVQFARGFNIVVANSGLMPQHIIRILLEEKVTEFLAISTVLKMIGFVYQSQPVEAEHLKKIYYGGEGCPVTVLQGITDIFSGVEFCQFYGPTENTNNTTYYHFAKPYTTPTGFMPLGHSLKHVELVLLDADNNPVSRRHEEGQIVISGKQLMEGYIGDPATSLSTLPAKGSKAYFTGDFGFFDENGLLWFTGRKDDLVKIRGNRVSLQEVEACVLKNMPVGAYAMAVITQCNGFDTLVVGVSSESAVDISEVKNRVAKELPAYAVPDKMIEIGFSTIKTLSTGKLDRKNFRASVLEQLEEKL